MLIGTMTIPELKGLPVRKITKMSEEKLNE
jgi:hypothetical protein